MTKGEETKEKIICRAAGLFWEKGYVATGVQDILTAAGVTKGSFYFYFKRKKDVGFAAAEFYEKRVLGMMEEIADREGAWEPFIRGVAATMIQEAEEGRFYGCPFSVLGMEIVFSEPDLAAAFLQGLEKIRVLFQTVLRQSGVPEGKAEGMSRLLLTSYEGYLLQYRLSKDIRWLTWMRDDLSRAKSQSDLVESEED